MQYNIGSVKIDQKLFNRIKHDKAKHIILKNNVYSLLFTKYAFSKSK